jgi:hypothetical protein
MMQELNWILTLHTQAFETEAVWGCESQIMESRRRWLLAIFS